MTRLYHNFDANATHYYILLHSLNSKFTKDNFVEKTVTGSYGTAKCYYNEIAHIAIVTFNAATGSGDGTITFPSGVSYSPAIHDIFAALRGGGYLRTDVGNARITITGATTYGVGQIVYPTW